MFRNSSRFNFAVGVAVAVPVVAVAPGDDTVAVAPGDDTVAVAPGDVGVAAFAVDGGVVGGVGIISGDGEVAVSGVVVGCTSTGSNLSIQD